MGSMQRRLAADILKVGQTKVWMDPAKAKDIEQAITRADVRRLILKKYIRRLPEKVRMRKERGEKRRGQGSRRGSKNSVVSSKTRWMQTVRALRGELKSLKQSKSIGNETYKQMRRLVKGGMFRSRSHLRLYLEQHGMLEKK